MSARKARRRSKRSIVCWYFLGLVAVQIGVGMAVEVAGPTLRDPVFERNAARLAARRTENPHKPLLLALGSSRTLMGLDAGRITQTDGRWLVYNFGDFGGGPMLEQVFLRRLLAAGVRPDSVLIELIPLQLGTGVFAPAEESSLDTGRLTAAEVRAISRYYRFPVSSSVRWLQALGLPCASRQRALHDALNVDNALVGAEATEDDFGFMSVLPSTPPAREASFRASLHEFGRWLPKSRLADGPVRAFRDLIALCRREQLPFTVILMPECQCFRRLQSPEFDAEVTQFLADMSRENAFPFLDARDWIAEDGFTDPHHLHGEGAKAFSTRLGREWVAGVKPSRQYPTAPGSSQFVKTR